MEGPCTIQEFRNGGRGELEYLGFMKDDKKHGVFAPAPADKKYYYYSNWTREVTWDRPAEYKDPPRGGAALKHFAMNKEAYAEKFPFSDLANKQVNVMIFPTLESGNIAYKLLQELAGFETIGPILVGMKKTIHILQLGASVKEIVNMTGEKGAGGV